MEHVKEKKLKPYEIFELAKEYSNKKNYEIALKYFNVCKKNKDFYENELFETIKIYFELEQYKKVVLYSDKCIKIFKNKNLKNNIKIILAKVYKIGKKEEKALKMLDSIKDNSIRKEEFFVWERLDCSFSKFNDFFRVSDFSGNIKELNMEFKKIKNLPPQNKVQLFYISRISNFLHNYAFTIELINRYKEKFDYIDKFYDNAILNEFEIATKKIVLKSKPRSMWIATSSKCNVHCKMCYAHKIDWKLSVENIKDIYEYIPYLESIVWWGGEPTISDLFYEMLNYSLQFKNIKQSIITNGQYMPQKFLDIVSKNNIEIIISIDSGDRKTYEDIRKGASFSKLKENLSKLSKLVNTDLIKINIVVMKNNLYELNKIIRFAKKFNIKKFSLRPICGDSSVAGKINLKDILYLNKKIKKLKNIDIFNSSSMIREDGKNKKNNIKGYCRVPWTDITFSYHGSLICDNLCEFFGNPVFMLEKYNMGQYWNSSIIQNLRKKVLKNGCCNINCPKANVKNI